MKPELNIEPEVIVRKVAGDHHAHHGGAWKIAYADFVTAMMAFFMLMWIIGATDEKQRKGIADYFSPTVIETRNSAGGTGVMGGLSPESPLGAADRPLSAGRVAIMPGWQPSTSADPRAAAQQAADMARFQRVVRQLQVRMAADRGLRRLSTSLRLTPVPEGLRIDLLERADFAMFAVGTSVLLPRAEKLLTDVAGLIAPMPNAVTIRGHTDALGFAGAGSNWALSAARADAVRRALHDAGIPDARFRGIEGVAATQPWNPQEPLDPRNRRISITLLYRDSPGARASR